jgi:hypothetical protein
MNDHSSIRDNTHSGGVGLYEGSSLTMNDSSTITGNRGIVAGGVMVEDGSVLTMRDSATITRNTSDARLRPGSGGVYAAGTLRGVICAPNANANVFDNSPDDCYP